MCHLGKILRMITNIKLAYILQWHILLQTVNKINAALQKLLIGNKYQHAKKKTKSRKGHNSAKIWRMITNFEFDLYFTVLQMLNEINASLQKLLSGNDRQKRWEKGQNSAKIWWMITNFELDLCFTVT